MEHANAGFERTPTRCSIRSCAVIATLAAVSFARAAAAASVVALLVHYELYYTGRLSFYYQGVNVKNPGIATALGVVAATAVGWTLYLVPRIRTDSASRSMSGTRV